MSKMDLLYKFRCWVRWTGTSVVKVEYKDLYVYDQLPGFALLAVPSDVNEGLMVPAVQSSQ